MMDSARDSSLSARYSSPYKVGQLSKDEYVGETKRALGVRKKEHSDAIRLGQCSKSAFAEHVHDHFPHDVDWSTSQVIDRACRQSERRVREALHIYKRQPKINRDAGVERSAVWNAVL